MKKVFLALGLMLSALALTNCSNNYDDVTPNVQGEEFEIFASAPSTKTVLGDGFVTSWVANDAINLFCGADGSQGKFTTADANGVFKGTLSGVDFTKENTWYAVYPYSGYLTTAAANEEGDGYISFGKNCSQDGYNSYAHLTDEYAPLYGITTTDADNTQVAFQMHHLGSMVKVVVTNAADEAVTITSVKFATKNSAIGGGHFVDLTATPIAYKSAFPNPYKQITLTVNNGTPLAKGATAEFYIATLPFVAAAGEELTLAVTTTERGDDSVVKTLTSAINFEAGHIKVLNFSYDKEAPAAVEGSYNRITELSQLADGCEAVIVAQNGGKYYALTSAGTSKPTQTEVTVNGETLDNASLKDALVMTVGVSNGNYTFKNGSSYLAWVEKTTMKFDPEDKTTFEVSVNGDYFNVKDTETSRYVALYTAGSDWRAYESLTQANSVPSLSFYVKGAQPDNRLESSLSFSQESFEVDLNGFSGTFTAPEKTLTPNGGTLTYSSDNTDVATVNVNTGDVTIVGKGTAVITATFAGDENYKGCSASYTITVVDTRGGKASFVKVTSAPADWSGTYLIVYESGKLAFDGSRTTLDAVSNTVSVTISNNEIEATDAMKAAAFTVVKNGSNYNIQSASGYYIGQTSNKNGLTSNKSTKYSNTLSVNNDASVNVVSGGAYLRYNATSGQTRFRYFKSDTYTNQKAIHFYKLVE